MLRSQKMQKWIKRVTVFLAVIVLLIAVVVLFLHTPWGKSVVRNEVRKYLASTLKTTVQIGKIDYRLPYWLQINDLLILDQGKDTLLYGRNVYARLHMLKLLQASIDVEAVQLEDIVLNLQRESQESNFNFQFIVDAFASPETKRDSASKSNPVKLNANLVSLKNIRLKFFDKKAKQYYSFQVGNLVCQPDQIRLQENTFHVNELVTSNVNISMIDSSNRVVNVLAHDKDSTYERPALFAALKKLGIKDFQFAYTKPSDKFNLKVNLDTLQLEQSSLDLAAQVFTGRRFLLHNSEVSLNAWINDFKPSNEKELIEKTAESTGWKGQVDFIDLYNNTLVYHNNAIKNSGGFDYNHLDIKRFGLSATQSKLKGRNFSTQIDSCSFIANEKFNLKGLRTNASISDSLVLVRDLEIGLNRSALITHGELAWEFKPEKKSRNAKFHCRIQNSSIAYADLLLIQPNLENSLPVNLPASGKLNLSGNVQGSINDFAIHRSKINGEGFFFEGNASLNLNKENFDVRIDKLKAEKNLLSSVMISKLKEQNIHLPEYIEVTGSANGTFNRVLADLQVNSEFGEARINGDVGNFSQPKNLQYNVELDLKEMETGKWIGMDSLFGKINGQIIADGSGVEPSTMNASVKLKMSSLSLNGYNYSNVDIDGELQESAFSAKGNIIDSNLTVSIDLSGDISGEYPSVSGILDIDHADLRKLGFSRDTMLLSTNVTIDIPVSDPANLNATIFADSTVLVINGIRSAADSIQVNGRSSLDHSQVDLHSPLIAVELKTNYSLDLLFDELKNISNRLYPPVDSLPGVNFNERSTEIHAVLNKNELVNTLIPGLKLEDSILVSGKYISAQTDSFLSINADAPAFSYKGIHFDQFKIRANNKEEAILVLIDANKIRSGGDTLFNPTVVANWNNKLLAASVQTEDSDGTQKYALNASMHLEKEATTVRILEDPMLNRRKWEVPRENKVVIKTDGLIFQNFSLTNKTQAVHITSKDPQTISPIEVRVDSFEIADILSIASFSDTALASGVLSADIDIEQPIAEFPAFTGTLGIKNLAIRRLPVGDLELKSHSLAEKLELSGNLKGTTHLEFSGNIDPVKGNLDVNAQIQKLDMKLIREFLSDYVSMASGNIAGELQLTGTTSDPQINGYIDFDTTTFALMQLNTPYRINDQKIEIKDTDFKFNNFVLSDTAGNKLQVDGTIKMIDASDYGLDLKANSKNFIAMDAPRRSESIIYGKAILDIDLNLKGTSNEPIIEGRGFLSGKSNIHYIMVESKNDYTSTAKGMIQFVDLDTLTSPAQELMQVDKDTVIKITKSFKGLRYNLNLEVSKDAEFSILIDPATGDELAIKGEANLNSGIAENGMMGITGTYQLNSGYYNMNSKFLKGKFMLVEGSTITFNGDPTEAETNVTTEYQIDASASGLLRPVEQEEYNTSKRLPFVIVLTIKGSISAPQLAFDIKLKEGATGIPSSLKSNVEEQLMLLRNDESKMNQQVFSLLVMNQFTVYNTGDFASSDLSPDVALKQGMSQFLAEGMNEIAGNLIKGVDINVNMESYKTDNAQTRTEMGFEMSKDMMNDRLTVTVGKNFTMGDDAAKYQNSSEQYIPDVSTAYKLSRDGRYQVKAYRKNEYDAVVEGYFTETGVAFSIQLEYNLFKQIFQSQKKLQE